MIIINLKNIKTMKTFEHQVMAESHMVTIQDAVIMAPFMDMLITSMNNKKGRKELEKLPWEEQRKYKHIERPEIDHDNIDLWFQILVEIGFCGTGAVDLLPEGTPLVLKEENQ